jgi:transposase
MAWKRASMAAALGYWPDATKARLCFHLQPDSYDSDSLIKVLEQLAGFYQGQRVVLIWDGLSSHWSHKMRAHLAAQRDWLTVERLPAYAPELNPVEYLWANLKDVELANLPTTTPGRSGRRRPTGHPARLQQRQPGRGVPGPHRPVPQPMNRQPNPRNSITVVC